jgi:hypothetical protein
MLSENTLHIKLAWIELTAAGTFTIATLAVLALTYFAVLAVRRRG